MRCVSPEEMGGVIPESVQADLRDVRSIAGNNEAFAAICGEDESVVTWGDACNVLQCHMFRMR